MQFLRNILVSLYAIPLMVIAPVAATASKPAATVRQARVVRCDTGKLITSVATATSATATRSRRRCFGPGIVNSPNGIRLS